MQLCAVAIMVFQFSYKIGCYATIFFIHRTGEISVNDGFIGRHKIHKHSADTFLSLMYSKSSLYG